jgi:hypothetical protein
MWHGARALRIKALSINNSRIDISAGDLMTEIL